MVQGKVTKAGTPTVKRVGATPSGLNSCPYSSFPHFLSRMPFLSQPSHFILA